MNHGCCHPMLCAIPPHMAEAIRMRGTPEQRQMAEAILKEGESYRQQRQDEAPPRAFMPSPALAESTSCDPQRKVYDAENQFNLPGTLKRSEGEGPTNDQEVDEAYDGAGDTYNLYCEVYGRDSLDGNGMTLESTVHYGQSYNNAFWNGQQMAYGDGDGVIFNAFTRSLSVIGHELSHGVVQFSGGLVYRDQSGALNESFADVFGALTVQYGRKQTVDKANWLVGDGLFAAGVQGVAIRSLKAPGTAYNDSILGKDPQPYHMDDFVVTSSDNGGVHINSGIPNHSFYLLAQYLGGNAWEKAGRIWYDSMQQINNPLATFNDWADKTVEVARNSYGSGSREALFTRRAWKLVGISV